MALPSWLIVALTVGAVARVTVLINDDYLTAGLRAWVDERGAHGRGAWPWLSYLLGCPWCVSMWAGLGIGAVVIFQPHAWWVDWPLLALSASYVTGYLAEIRERIDR